MQLAVNKNQKYFLSPELQLAWNLILVLDSMKGQKSYKIKFVTKFIEIIVTIFSYKNVSQSASKDFAT